MPHALMIGKYLNSGKEFQVGGWYKRRHERHKFRKMLDVFKAEASHSVKDSQREDMTKSQ